MTSADHSAVLDNAVWHALRGQQRRFAITDSNAGTVRAARYRADMTTFAAVDDVADPEAWAQLARIVSPGERVAIKGPTVTAPEGWQPVGRFTAVQMIDSGAEPDAASSERIVPLTLADSAEMLALAELTQPGPFGPATVELGGFVGIRDSGRLVAMAGRRFQLDGWVEISGVCTHPDARGHGYARELVAAVRAGIRTEGRRAFLHVLDTNTSARGLYETMGFVRRTDQTVLAVTR